MVWEAPAGAPVELCFEAIDLLGLDQETAMGRWTGGSEAHPKEMVNS